MSRKRVTAEVDDETSFRAQEDPTFGVTREEAWPEIDFSLRSTLWRLAAVFGGVLAVAGLVIAVLLIVV